MNRANWAHCLAGVACILERPRAELLTGDELSALDHQTAPQGIVIHR